MTVIEWQASQIEMAAGILAHFVTKTDPARLDWKPKAEGEDSKSRSIYDYLGECISINNGMAARLRGEESAPEEPAELSDCETACAQLRASGKNFADALRSCDESIFDQKFQFPFGELSGTMLVTIPVSNMHYHAGQVNYVQCLYGDDVFHMPGKPD